MQQFGRLTTKRVYVAFQCGAPLASKVLVAVVLLLRIGSSWMMNQLTCHRRRPTGASHFPLSIYVCVLFVSNLAKPKSPSLTCMFGPSSWATKTAASISIMATDDENVIVL